MKNNSNTDVKNVAKHYRDVLGFNVIPLKAGSKRPALPKDHPYLHRRATNTEFESFGFKNVGIVTGKTSGIVVLDVDYVGPDTLKQKGWAIPPTVTVKTMNGKHYYFRYPSNAERVPTKIGFAEGLDFKADGGYVVAPPSVVEKKGRDRKGIDFVHSHQYEWIARPEDLGIAECPEWLLRAITEHSGGFSEPVEATIQEGQRNSTLFSLARSLFRKGLNEVEVFQALYAVNRNRCMPPLDNNELEQIVRSAAKYERGELRIEVSPSLSFKGSDNDDTLPEARMFKDMTPPKGPRPYIVNGVVFKGFAGALYGDGGSAKSMLVMHMGQRVARGEDWLGFDTVKTNVLYLDFELDEEEQSRRAYQVAAGDGYTQPPEGFFYLSAAGHPTRIIFEQALRTCIEHGIGLVLVDSLGFALEGDAEVSRDVLKFFREVEGAFRRQGITLLIVDHQAKHQPGSKYQEKTMFGSVYKSNSIRSVLQVEPGEHNDGYIRLTVRHKKANFGPLLQPFGVEATFLKDEDEDEVRAVKINTRALDATELAEEGTLNATDRVLAALNDGPVYPAEIADATGLELGTVKNSLTALRKSKDIENTGNRDRHGSNEVRLVSSPSSSISDDDTDTGEQFQGSREDGDKETVCECGGSGCVECWKQELPFDST